MAIIVNIDVMLAKRKMSVTELAEKVGITMANISVLKNGKARAIRLSTLEAICKALKCQPGDILEYEGYVDPSPEVWRRKQLTTPAARPECFVHNSSPNGVLVLSLHSR